MMLGEACFAVHWLLAVGAKWDIAGLATIGTDCAEAFSGATTAVAAEATTVVVKRRASTRAKTAWSVASAEST